MSTPAPIIQPPIDTLRARIDRLAIDPRVRLVPDGGKIVLELRAVLELVHLHGLAIAEHATRLVALERSLSSIIKLEDRNCDD